MQLKSTLTQHQKIKKSVWMYIYPFFRFPFVQKYILRMHLSWYKHGRQQYPLGWIAPGKTLVDVQEHLSTQWGFGNHFVAWIDSGQIVSWRKLVNFDYQYHIRIFNDGEIRGHYEYTPESKPFKHLFEVDEEKRTEEFHTFLDGFVVYEKYVSRVELVVGGTIKPQLHIDTPSVLVS